jgi:pimeloyl-ACP methyl ester carboxylesterase
VPRLRVEAVELAYDEVGDGEALVFLSGTSLDRTVWGPQVAVRRPPSLHHLDNRDVGESTQMTGGTPRHGGRRRPARRPRSPAAHVVGLAGGAVAQEPLALLTASDHAGRSWACNDEHAPSSAPGNGCGSLEPAAFEAILLPASATPSTASTPTPWWLFLAAPHRSAEPCRQVDADLAHDTLDRLGKIQPPTLVIAGDEDKIFPSHHARQLAEGIGCDLLMIPGVGHSPALENPAAVNAALETFFTSH